jgi:hypothetical protein
MEPLEPVGEKFRRARRVGAPQEVCLRVFGGEPPPCTRLRFVRAYVEAASGSFAGRPIRCRNSFRKLCVAQISFHSAATRLSPRNRNLRILRISLIWPKTGSMARKCLVQAYNAQAAADSHAQVIVAADVTQRNISRRRWRPRSWPIDPFPGGPVVPTPPGSPQG